MWRRGFLHLLADVVLSPTARTAAPATTSKLVYPGTDGRLVYTADTQGNRIPDFSNCGYAGGGVRLPEIAEQATVTPSPSDATERIQAAIDKVSQLPPDEHGFRGAVLLK